MTFTVSPWWVGAVLWLALFGVVWWWQWFRDAARDARAWWRDRRAGRIDPPWWWKPWLSRRERPKGISDDCWYDAHEDCDGCECDCCDCSSPLATDLPPERSAEALGFTSPPPESAELCQWRRDEARRERLASAAELEHRAAYEAMGLEFPSGLLARVREAAQ